MIDKTLTQAIDAVLPQTQCRACGYKDCLAYASAVANKQAKSNLCQPGGTKTFVDIERILPSSTSKPDIKIETKLVEIQDNYCVGCTKCLAACPVDAIYGATDKLHHIIPDLCTGCNLCISLCPTDCIVPSNQDHTTLNPTNNRLRYLNKKKRLSDEKKEKKSMHQKAKRQRKDYNKDQQARLDYIQSIMLENHE